MSIAEQLVQERAIENVLNRYARACDERDWKALANVFATDVSVDYGGEFKLDGREAVVGMVRSMLGGCGPTQHLLGNFTITHRDDEASCKCYVRAAHAGTGAANGLFYEVWAEYHDELRRTEAGWSITRRKMIVHQEVGTREVLQPPPS